MLCPQEDNIPTYHFGVNKYVVVSTSRVMFRAHYSQRHCVRKFQYFSLLWELSNSISIDPNAYHIQKLCPKDVDIETYHFGVHKTVCVSSSYVIVRVNYRIRNCIDPLHYFSPSHILSNSLFRNPNIDYILMFYPKKVEVPSLHFKVHKNIVVSPYRVMSRVHNY